MAKPQPKSPISWTTHLAEAEMLLSKLVACGALDNAQAENCRPFLPRIYTEHSPFVLISVDVRARPADVASEIGARLPDLKKLLDPRKGPPSVALHPSQTVQADPDTNPREWVLEIRDRIGRVWPQICAARAAPARRDILMRALRGIQPHDRLEHAIEDVAPSAGLEIKDGEECADEIAARIMGSTVRQVRDLEGPGGGGTGGTAEG